MSRDSATHCGDAGLPETTFYHGSQGQALGAPGTGRQNCVLGTSMSSHCMLTRHPSVSPTQGSAASTSQGETFQTRVSQLDLPRDSKTRSGGEQTRGSVPSRLLGMGSQQGAQFRPLSPAHSAHTWPVPDTPTATLLPAAPYWQEACTGATERWRATSDVVTGLLSPGSV